MIIHELAPTPSARRVSIFLAEMGIEVPRVQIDLRGGDNLKPEFRAKSVNGRIPMLELDDGTCLCETMAICRFFDASSPRTSSLFGETPLEQGQVEMWNRILELEGIMVAFQAFRNLTGVFRDRERCVEAWGVESRERLEELLPRLEARLEGRQFVAIDRFSVADITGYVLLDFCRQRLELETEGRYPNLSRWYQTIHARPAIAALG
ncbi:glutathione S-transferase family protein [Aeromonas diversa]|uniref:glutathione S-transferase family protein n=1 Tax=Aeromonas diversa TaxID=502790 RepID=UPI003462E644